MNATLVLENGFSCTGRSFGAEGETTGEIVFNTGLTGYQEILTDPSYCGQIVTMTSPMIGNYGVNGEDPESPAPAVAGFVVKEYTPVPSNYRATSDLGSWLRARGIVAIEGIDTRMITRMIREKGAMRSIISTRTSDVPRLLDTVQASPSMTGLNLAGVVTCRQPYQWTDAGPDEYRLAANGPAVEPGRFHVVVYDYGVKRNILRRLVNWGCRCTVVPAGYPAESVLAMHPDGVMLSNGPGDPAAVTVAIEAIRVIIGRIPLFGICLGHQLLALALGGTTYKLKFGHRGINHPVRNHLTGDVEITSQNHGFAVDPASLDSRSVEITHTNLNDGTNEGFRHRSLPVFSVQYHPESAPGPHDSDYLFGQFLGMMTANASAK